MYGGVSAFDLDPVLHLCGPAFLILASGKGQKSRCTARRYVFRWLGYCGIWAGGDLNSLVNNSVFAQFFVIAVDQSFSECGPWTRSISLTWKHVINAETQIPPQIYEIWIHILTRFPRDSYEKLCTRETFRHVHKETLCNDVQYSIVWNSRKLETT